MARSFIINSKGLREFISAGEMSVLKEIPEKPEKKAQMQLKDFYFDEFDTYAPGAFRRSRRLTKEELKELGEKDT